MTNSSSSSSDLELAAALYGRLTGTGEQADKASEILREVGYVKFLPPRSSEAQQRVSATRPATPDLSEREFDSWEELLAWCLDQVQAASALVVDLNGFVVASAGRVAQDTVEGLGARLHELATQAQEEQESSGPLHSIELRYEQQRVVVIPPQEEQASGYLVVLVKTLRVDDELIAAIARQVDHNFARLM